MRRRLVSLVDASRFFCSCADCIVSIHAVFQPRLYYTTSCIEMGGIKEDVCLIQSQIQPGLSADVVRYSLGGRKTGVTCIEMGGLCVVWGDCGGERVGDLADLYRNG